MTPAWRPAYRDFETIFDSIRSQGGARPPFIPRSIEDSVWRILPGGPVGDWRWLRTKTNRGSGCGALKPE